jgi:L-2-hydroxyglutarate oxidase LhgO
VEPERLHPDYTGIRPKLGAGSDFAILGPAEHGVPGYAGLHGIESPGLTSALALADRVADLVASRG